MTKKVPDVIKRIGVRIYTAVIVLLLIWAGYTAVAYLIRSVFQPTRVPKEFVEWTPRIDAETLRTADVSGRTSPTQSPPGHYHHVDRWFQPDPYNGCTLSPCHSPMPHNRRLAVRSFANFHATFMSCQMCHEKPAARPVAAAWIGMETGQAQDPPAVLALMSHLEHERDKIENRPAEIHGVIVELLHRALETTGTEPVLEYLRVQIDTSEPGSPVWRHAIAQLTEELPRHLRGEYGAKLAPRSVAENYRKIHKQLSVQAERYFSAKLSATERKAVHEDLHGSMIAAPKGCVDCHGAEPGMLDFQALGYSAERTRLLKSTPLARQMLEIQEGRPFHLPRIMGSEDEDED